MCLATDQDSHGGPPIVKNHDLEHNKIKPKVKRLRVGKVPKLMVNNVDREADDWEWRRGVHRIKVVLKVPSPRAVAPNRE